MTEKALFRNKEFLSFISARLMFTIAILMQSVVIGWQMYELTKDPFALGLAGLTEAIPSIITALISGAIVDSRDRKKVLTFAYALMFICSVSLFLVSSAIFPLIVSQKVFLMYCIIFITGISRGFYMPASQALLGQLVDKSVYPFAVSWNISIWQIGAISGPAIGGFVYGFFGINVTYLIIISFVFLAITFISLIKPKPKPVIKDMSIFEKLTSGMKFVFNKKVVLGSMTLDLFAVLFGGATALLPVFASEILDAGPKGLGILRAAPSVGAVIMALYLTKHPPLKNTGKYLFFSVAAFGLAILLFAISKSFYLSVTALALSGMFDTISVVIRQTILQLYTPDDMKGRVSAVNSIFIGSSNEIGAFESGLAAKLIGVVPSVIFGGLMTLAVVGVSSFTFPSLRKLQLKDKQ
ncbi:MAG: MFS transporter [Ignavibacteriae bacterium]|nr:MFS transporter [Ignavibacteriota bacterium]